jgi:hypothetical protein
MMVEIASGELVTNVLRAHGITAGEKRGYLARVPAARQQWDEARECSADAYYDEALDVARGQRVRTAGNDASEHATPARDPQEARLLVDTLKWAARIRNPRLYSDKQTLDVNVRTVDLTRIIQDANARLAASRPPALIEHATGELVPEAGAGTLGAILESMLR